ncbi:MAG: YbhB/YbcL family Raf kinase inhibitor-like protein [Gammaproteobacteria bacterium]|nr:YbhB/YbcL family Raf kinase inhibitor-like protein [Gammaproteobacteria bacterium]MBU1440318.1 YbhB/YbcL family Raf kinase inhibitor-like protein [Gammaproteobacteria bacterium]MBU2286836.1 YbhB/YbcL family Raf kinase inhibitor-like protein [Gammaproteobacteria bacterium]MBU2407720.1 YbhB/YbcL family Raf kinase inhibitor-like protein [Gammaproteobacteria bacterium]
MLEKLPDVVGHALSGVRAGLDEITFNTLGMRQGMASITVGSLAFADHAPIPDRYTADGQGLSPPLQWTGVPAGTASLVLMVEDADSPTPSPLVHAIAVDLPAGDGALAEAAFASSEHDGDENLHAGRNSLLQAAWMPPDPPPGHGVHRYAFQIFALNAKPEFSSTPGRDEVVGALQAHATASGLLIGTCERPDGSIKIEDDAPAGPAIAG